MERKRTEIQELQDKLSKGGNAMAQAAKDDLARSIDTKTKSYNRDMEDAQAEAQAEERKMLEELSGKMQVVIEKYAQANGLHRAAGRQQSEHKRDLDLDRDRRDQGHHRPVRQNESGRSGDEADVDADE